MNWSWRIGRLARTDINVHSSFIILLVFLWMVRQPESLLDLLDLAVLLFILFGSVLLHEVGHTVAAQRFGIGVSQIILWPLGGMALLAREPEQQRQALVISAAGPAVNLALAAVAFAALSSLSNFMADGVAFAFNTLHPAAFLRLVVVMNGGLALFNLLPAYPLDGGRILRSALILTLGERRATRITVVVSSVLGSGMVVYAVFRGDPFLLVTALLMLLATATLHPHTQDRLHRAWMFVADRGYWHLLRNEPLPAIARFDRILARDPRNARVTHNRAWAYLMRSDFDRAIADYDRTIALTPFEPKPYADRGMAAHMIFRFREALDFFERARALGLDASWLSIRRGLAQRSLGNWSAACADFDRAIVLAPYEPAAYAARSLARLRLGDHDGALADINHCVALRPDDAEALVYRSQVYWNSGDRVHAAHDSAHAMVMNPQVALVHDEHCLLALWRGQLPWALDHYARAEERGLDPAAISVGRGDAYRINEEHALAIADYDRALHHKPDDGALLARGWSYRALGNFQAARMDFEAVLRRVEHPNLRRLARLELAEIMARDPTKVAELAQHIPAV